MTRTFFTSNQIRSSVSMRPQRRSCRIRHRRGDSTASISVPLPLSNTYTYNFAGAGVTAYIVDSGIHASHVDFGGRVRSGFTTVNDGHGTDDWCVGHGTHVAGTVGGQTYGVAKSVSLVAVRVLACDGTTDGSQLIQGLDWVIADHQAGVPAVANLSIGGGASASVDLAVRRVVDDGITVVVAAGNDNADACSASPAREPSVLTAAASTDTDARASFSNFGPCVDLFAPGNLIGSDFITLPPPTPPATASNTETATESGTSMASPHVAGAAAVLLSEHPTWTPAQVTADLLADATVNVITDPKGSPNRLLFSSPISPPTNDDFAAATPIDLAGPSTLAGSNIDATAEPGEPAHGPVSGGRSVWWSFVAPAFGRITLSTEGSSFDTMLASYSGSAVNGLTTLTSSDGAGNGSTVTFNVVPGRTYHVAVDGAGGAAGSVVLGVNWRPAALVPLVPGRLLDSRLDGSTVDGLFARVGVRGAGSVTELLVAGRGGVVGDASAVVLTVTVTEPGAAGFVSVFPCGGALPLASSVNFVAGATVANSVVVGCGCWWSGVCVHESGDAVDRRRQRVLPGGVVVWSVGAGAVVGFAVGWCRRWMGCLRGWVFVVRVR